MKKRKIAITLTLAAALAVTPVLGGCAGDHYGKISFAAQDTTYAVTSQGGSAVSYGNYVYFINGTRGFDDSEGKANIWDEVVKGALYRAEFNGAAYTSDDGLRLFKPQADAEGVEFKYEADEDYFGNPENVAEVSKIAPKTVGTNSYERGGIFIYDNCVYFASPNNQKNSVGTVQTNRTDFFMMPLGGGKPTKIYTTAEGVDTSASAHAFYKYGNYVYLVTYEGTDIVSVRIDPAKNKVATPVKLYGEATSVYFPVRDVYYNGISTDTPEDFIYFVRAVKEDRGEQRVGTVIEAMRPDGSENFVISENSNTETIEAVRDGLLFFRTSAVTSNGSVTVIKYTNLHEQLLEHSASYAETQKDGSHIAATQFATEIGDSITATYAFRPDTKSNEAYLLAVTSSGIVLYDHAGNGRTVYSESATIKFVRDGYLYISDSDSNFYRVALWDTMNDYGTPQHIAENATTTGICCDYVNGYFTYYSKVDDWASNYTFFCKVDGPVSEETEGDGELTRSYDAMFVGLRAPADIPTKEQLEAAGVKFDD